MRSRKGELRMKYWKMYLSRKGTVIYFATTSNIKTADEACDFIREVTNYEGKMLVKRISPIAFAGAAAIFEKTTVDHIRNYGYLVIVG